MASGGAPLEFLFELDAKIDGVVKMLDTVDKSVQALHALDKATTKTTAALDHVEKATRHAADGHQKHAHSAFSLGHAVEGTKDKVHGLLEALGLILVFEGFEKLTEKAIELGSEILQAAAGAERTQKSFELLLGNEGAEELLGYVESIMRFTELTDDQLKSTAGSLLRVGFAGEQLHRALAASLDIAAMPGGSLEGALSSIERVKRTGHVDNRVLGGLGFGEKDFFAELEKRTGKTTATLKKQLESGKLDTNEALETLYTLIHKRTGKALGAAGVEMSETLQARMKHLKGAAEQIFEEVAKTEAFARLSESVGKLAADLEPGGPLGSKIKEGLEVAFGDAASIVAGIDWTSGIDTMLSLLKTSLSVVESIAGGFASAVGFVQRLEDELEGVLTLGHLTDKLGLTSIGTRHERLNRELNGDTDVMRANEKFAAGKERLKAVRQVRSMGDFSALGPGLSQGLYLGALGSVDRATQAGAVVGKAAVDGARVALDAHSPSRAFEELGRMSGEGYVRGLDESTRRIDDAVDRSLGMADAVPTGAFARPATSAPFGPIEVTVNVITNVVAHGTGGAEATPQEIGDQVAKSVRDQVREELHSILEGIGIEDGGGV